MTQDEPKFSDKDVRKIIQKALDIQKRERASEGTGEVVSRTGDYSLSDIEQAAGEIGLSPELVHQAATELDTGGRSSFLHRFLGAETTIVATGRSPRSADPETLQELAATMQAIVGIVGAGNVHGSAYSWTTTSADVERRGFATEVTVRSRQNGTIVEVTDRLGQLAGGLYGGILGGVGLGAGLGVGLGVGLGALGSPLFAAIFAIGTFTLSFGLSRLIYTSVAKQRRKTTKQILNKILDFFADSRG
jgi:hypothetical protein